MIRHVTVETVAELVHANAGARMHVWAEGGALTCVIMDGGEVTTNVYAEIHGGVPKSIKLDADLGRSLLSSLPGRVTMFSKTQCKYCVTAMDLLRARGIVNIKKINLDEYPEGTKKWLVDRTRARTVPQLFFNDEWQEGGAEGLLERDESGVLNCVLVQTLSRPLAAESELNGF